MPKSTDHEFNEIVYDSVLPEIARAFCSLKKEVSGNKLAGQTPENWEAIARIKSAALKRTIDFLSESLSQVDRRFCRQLQNSQRVGQGRRICL